VSHCLFPKVVVSFNTWSEEYNYEVTGEEQPLFHRKKLPVALVVIGMGLRLLPATRPASRKAFDWQGMAALSLALAALTYGINQIDTAHFGASLLSLQVWPFLLLALLLVTLPLASHALARASLFERRGGSG